MVKIKSSTDASKKIIGADDYSVAMITKRAKQAKNLLSQAYSILDSIGDYADSLIDWSLVEDVAELCKNIEDAFDL